MPRYARRKCDTGIFHIMLRGINKQTIFEDDEDKDRFLDTIERFKSVSKYEIYGFCLMCNHVHLLLKETEEPISVAIKRICSSYVYWYNRKYERCGHLFQERYKSETVENNAYLMTVLRYIHQNPVKAGLSRSVRDYMWSSYNEYIRKPSVTDTGFVLQLYSDNSKKAVDLLITHTNEQNDEKCLEYEDKTRLSDAEVREYFIKLGLQNSSDIQKMRRDERNNAIRQVKAVKGVTIRQISRITGISKSVIARV